MKFKKGDVLVWLGSREFITATFIKYTESGYVMCDNWSDDIDYPNDTGADGEEYFRKLTPLDKALM